MARLGAAIATAVALILSFSIGTAQAADWVIGGQPLTVLGIGSESTTSKGGKFEIATTFGAGNLPITIACTSESGSGEIIKGSGATGKASMTLKSCTVKGVEGCTVHSTGQSAGTILLSGSTKFFALEVESNERPYEELSLAADLAFTGCILPEEVELKGTTAAEVPLGEEELIERPQKFSEAIVKASGVAGLKFGAKSAYLTGEDTEVLSGAHAGEEMGTTFITVNPAPVAFAGLESRNVVLTNSGPLHAKYTKIEIAEGPYTLTDATPCKGSKFPPTKTCTIGVTCETRMSVGRLEIRWDVLTANDELKGFNRRFVDLSCA